MKIKTSLMYRSTLSVLVALLLSLPAFSQREDARFSFGIKGGAFLYAGDLTPSRAAAFKTLRPAWGIYGIYRWKGAYSIRADFNSGSLHGNDALFRQPEWRQRRAFRFNTSVREASVSISVSSDGPGRLKAYGYTGLGYALSRVARDASAFDSAYFAAEGLDKKLAEDMARTPPRGQPFVPVAAGLSYRLGPSLALDLEGTYRLWRTDYLDGFSIAGNPDRGDHFLSLMLGLRYIPQKKGGVDCPKGVY